MLYSSSFYSLICIKIIVHVVANGKFYIELCCLCIHSLRILKHNHDYLFLIILTHDAHRPDCEVGRERRVRVYLEQKINCLRPQESMITRGQVVL